MQHRNRWCENQANRRKVLKMTEGNLNRHSLAKNLGLHPPLPVDNLWLLPELIRSLNAYKRLPMVRST